MTPEQQRAWMEQWRSAASALAEYKARRLRSLTTEEAFAESDTLLSMARPVTPDEPRYSWSGLVEQQAIFHGRHRK